MNGIRPKTLRPERLEDRIVLTANLIPPTASETLSHGTASYRRFDYPNSQLNGRLAEFVDLNGDGLLDVVGPTEDGLEFYFSTGRATFQQSSLTLAASESWRYYVDHFDNTPGADIVIVATAQNDMATHVHRVEVQKNVVSLGEPFVTRPGIAIEVKDLDADNLADLVMRSDFDAHQQYASVLLNRGPSWLENQLSDHAATVAIEDLEGDGLQEVYVFDDPVRVFRYSGIQFELSGEIPKGTSRLQVQDANNDGRMDFLSVQKDSFDRTTVRVFVNQADDLWVAWTPVETSSEFHLIDANNDGLLDIAGKRSFFISDGNGEWEQTALIESASTEWTEQDHYVDLDDDGWTDLVKLDLIRGELQTFSLSENLAWRPDDTSLQTAGAEVEFIDVDGNSIPELIAFVDGKLTMRSRREYAWGEEITIATNLRDVDWLEDRSEFAATDEHGVVHYRISDGEILVAANKPVTPPSDTVDSQWPDWVSDHQASGFPVVSSDLDADEDDDLVVLSADGITVLEHLPSGDFDRDGALGSNDLQLLTEMVREPNSSTSDWDRDWDVNSDGWLDEDDVSYWISQIGGFRLGDTDLDGRVRFSDFLALAKNFGEHDAVWQDGDFDLDGRVEFADFLLLMRNFGR